MSPIRIRRPGTTTTTTTTPAPQPPTTSTTAAPGKPPRITRNMPFRQVGALSTNDFCEIVRGYPLAAECADIRAAVDGQILPLAQSYKESQYGKTASAKNNPLGLMELDGRTLKTFTSWAEAFAEWQRRMDDPSYKNGVYMPLDMSLERYIRIYVAGPGPGYANGETAESVELYLRQTIARLNRYLGYDDPDPTWTGTTPAPEHPATRNPFPKPTIYTLANDYARFGLTKGQADRILGNHFPNRNGGSPRYIVNHIQDGTTPGSLNWWAVGPGVQASSTVMANRDGSILRIIPERHGPWTNGDVCNPTAKSAGLRALGGNPNHWSLTLEAEGKPGITSVTYTDPELRAICWQFAEWMTDYSIPLANVLSHATINGCERQNCPGEANQRRVLDELKRAGFA